MPSKKQHKQVPAKVTVFVDEGIKDLVELMNTFDGVSTIDSCQGGYGELAYVILRYGDHKTVTFAQVARFAHRLAGVLSRAAEKGSGMSPDPAYDVELSLKWSGLKKYPHICIDMPSDSIAEVTRIFYDGRHEVSDNIPRK